MKENKSYRLVGRGLLKASESYLGSSLSKLYKSEIICSHLENIYLALCDLIGPNPMLL